MYRSRISGFSMVELLVAVVIGLIGSVIIFQVFSAFEGQKRATTSGGDAQTNIAVATNALERAGRHAGYGINFRSHMGCDVVVWRQNSAPPVPPALADPGTLSVVKLVPVVIDRDVGGLLTALTFVGSASDDSYSVTQLTTGMAGAPNITESNIKPGNMYGIDQGDVLILAEKKDTADAARRNKITCAAMEARWLLPNPPPIGTLADTVDHTIGQYTKTIAPGVDFYTQYNKTGGLETLTSAQLNPLPPAAALFDLPLPDLSAAGIRARFTFSTQASVMNVGAARISPTGVGLRRSVFTLTDGQLLENGSPVVDNIVFMDAQYGLAPSAASTSGTVTYVRTMPEDLTRDPRVLQDDWFRLRTLRLVLIARVGQYEKTVVSPSSFTVWGAPDPHNVPVTYVMPNSQAQHYRYKVVELVIPLRNMFWRPQ